MTVTLTGTPVIHTKRLILRAPEPWDAAPFCAFLGSDRARFVGGTTNLIRVEVVRSRFVFDEYFAGLRIPRSETIHAQCAVGGTATAQDATRRLRKDAR